LKTVTYMLMSIYMYSIRALLWITVLRSQNLLTYHAVLVSTPCNFLITSSCGPPCIFSLLKDSLIFLGSLTRGAPLIGQAQWVALYKFTNAVQNCRIVLYSDFAELLSHFIHGCQGARWSSGINAANGNGTHSNLLCFAWVIKLMR